ncbi:MAG: hypothetical protein DBW85_00795 [Synechococcus sp. MED-G71]|nr:MAG: hypothetical protein DBW85_00795 [Synechococcus sp. MED-G71]
MNQQQQQQKRAAPLERWRWPQRLRPPFTNGNLIHAAPQERIRLTWRSPQLHHCRLEEQSL